MSRLFRVVRILSLSATAALALLMGPVSTALAHSGGDRALSSQKLKMQWDQANSKRNKFLYKTRGQLEINDLSMDPSTVTTSVIVRGTGVGDGDTGVIMLDPTKWSALGSKGWKYKHDSKHGLSYGVKLIKIKTSSKGGTLLIKGKGSFWSYDIFQPQSGIEIMLAVSDQIYCAQYGLNDGELDKNEGSLAEGKGRVQGRISTIIPGGECPSACGNGLLETGEECDDGNDDDADTCSNSCIGCDPQDAEFASTYEGIQALIFDNPVFGCSDDLCHGANFTSNGNLDLRAGTSYGQLVNVPSALYAGVTRVFAGDQDLSLLYSKLHHGVNGSPVIPNTGPLMPQGGNPPITPELLEALRLWIRGGAPEDTVVVGTPELLGACLPAASPNKIPQPAAPDPTLGVQFAMPGYPLNSQDERELCVPSYYDLSASVPAQFRIPCPGAFPGTNDTDECFAWDYSFLAQDPQSHHSIIHIYSGDYDWDDAGWGGWRCYLGDNDGQTCDPTTADPCPGGGVCGGIDKEGVACLSAGGFGPPDFSNFNGTAPTFGGSQESTSTNNYPVGVYAVLPLKGVIVWNSHAFNLTAENMRMQAWLNMEYTDTLTYPAKALFDTKAIFTQDVNPYEQEEYCDTFTFPAGVTTHLFSLSSHTHRFGKRWVYYQAPQTPCASVASCSPGSPGAIFYESFEYSDPLTLDRVDDPFIYSGTVNDRTIKYCALYDNGATDPSEVKRQSTSPCPAIGPCGGSVFGGPCTNATVKCLGGPNVGQLCFGDDNNCPGSVCDACNVLGGTTTEDEMFIPLGTYYTTP